MDQVSRYVLLLSVMYSKSEDECVRLKPNQVFGKNIALLQDAEFLENLSTALKAKGIWILMEDGDYFLASKEIYDQIKDSK